MAVTDTVSNADSNVVEGGSGLVDVDKSFSWSALGRRSASYLLLMVVLIVLCSWPLVPAWAEPTAQPQSSEGAESKGTLTDRITDPQNLLGSQVGAVSDAIDLTEQSTGVHVRLLYLPTFTQGSNPDSWASEVLESSKPRANTLLLAVASQEGKLVVAVSANSQDWLKRQSTVDDLSNAALQPISDTQHPNWVGSAQALMQQVHDSYDNQQRSRIITYGAIGALVVVVAAVSWWALRLRRKKAHIHHEHSEHSDNAQQQAAS